MKNNLLIAAGPVLAALLSLISLPLIAWFYSAEDVGRFSILQVALGLGLTILSLQMHQSYVREYYSLSGKEQLLISSLLPSIIITLVSTLLLFIFNFSLSEIIFDIDSSVILVAFLLNLYSLVFINGYVHVVRMQGRAWVFSVMQVFPKLIFLLFIFISSHISIKKDFEELIVINAGTYLISFFLFTWLIKDVLKKEFSLFVNLKLINKMLQFSLPLLMGSIAYWGLTASDRFFIKTLSGLNELAIYSIAISVASAVFLISTVFSTIWQPIVYQWIEDGIDVKKTQPVIEGVFLLVSLIWSVFGLSSWLFKFFLPKEYFSIEWIITSCIAAPLFYLLSETTGFGISVTRRTSYAMLSSISALIVNIGLNYFLVPGMGAAGAAFASMMSFFVFFIVKTESSARLLYPFPRARIYAVSLFYISISTFVLFSRCESVFIYFLWVIGVVISIFFFPETAKVIKNVVIINVSKRWL